MSATLMEANQTRVVLDGMTVDGWRGVYVLGCVDRRVTVYSQQVRALNLAAALISAGRVKPGDVVVIVGAGTAGLTCAAGLHHHGVKVIVLEKDETILPLFCGGSRRWLHPGVYDWPLAGWRRDEAGLPLLNWKHGLVDEVRKQIANAWSQLPGRDRLVLHAPVAEVKLGAPMDSPRTVSWNPFGS